MTTCDQEPKPELKKPLEGMRVLVAEDNYLSALSLTQLLSAFGCTIVGPVPRLERARREATIAELDGALLDINLAGEDVYPAARELRTRRVPFAFLTGYSESMMPDEFRGTPCLLKPFSAESLFAIVRSMFDRRSPQHDPTLSAPAAD